MTKRSLRPALSSREGRSREGRKTGRRLIVTAETGAPLDSIASVASFFLSRIDTKVDERACRARAPELVTAGAALGDPAG